MHYRAILHHRCHPRIGTHKVPISKFLNKRTAVQNKYTNSQACNRKQRPKACIAQHLSGMLGAYCRVPGADDALNKANPYDKSE